MNLNFKLSAQTGLNALFEFERCPYCGKHTKVNDVGLNDYCDHSCYIKHLEQRKGEVKP